jgi:hypothetical protein
VDYGVVLTAEAGAVDEVKAKECREGLAGRAGGGR